MTREGPTVELRKRREQDRTQSSAMIVCAHMLIAGSMGKEIDS